MKDRIKVGVVGCGYWALNHVWNLNSLYECPVKRVCDKDKRRLSHIRTLYPERGCYSRLDSAHVRKIKEVVDAGEIGELQYISARRLNRGLFSNRHQRRRDLAPHDLSIIVDVP